jgi:NAD(P)-dependent dehydrogenase (short-subunit alcohol dehydrogenase family)
VKSRRFQKFGKESEYFVSSRWSVKDTPSLSGRTIVITGANSGLGLETARYLAAADAKVVLACRNRDKANRAVQDIRATTSNGELMVMDLDLARLVSVNSFVDELTSQMPCIDVLVNNAGVMALDRGMTEDGFETHFGINHLGHFALTTRLLPLIEKSGQGRVVNVSSMGHRPGRIDLDDPMYEHRRYSRWGAYFQSKLANLLFTRELDHRLRLSKASTIAVAAHPGTARTELGKLGTSVTNTVMRKFTPVLVRTGVEGAISQVRAAVDPALRGGMFVGPRFHVFGDPVVETPSRRARNDDDARRLWDLSSELTQSTMLM